MSRREVEGWQEAGESHGQRKRYGRADRRQDRRRQEEEEKRQDPGDRTGRPDRKARKKGTW